MTLVIERFEYASSGTITTGNSNIDSFSGTSSYAPSPGDGRTGNVASMPGGGTTMQLSTSAGFPYTSGTFYASAYFYYPSAPPSYTGTMMMYSNAGNTTGFQFTSVSLTVQARIKGSLTGGTYTLTANTWYRMTAQVDMTALTVTLKLFAGDSTTALLTTTGSLSGLTSMNDVEAWNDKSGGPTIYVDSFQAGDVSGALGPDPTAAAATPYTASGTVSAITLAAPAGTVGAGVTLAGPVAGITLAAPAGTVTAGTGISFTAAGTVSGITLSAPAGSVSAAVNMAGTTAGIVAAAPAGTVTAGTVASYTASGVTASITLVAPAGSVTTAAPSAYTAAGAVGTITLAAPAGTVTTPTVTAHVWKDPGNQWIYQRG